MGVFAAVLLAGSLLEAQHAAPMYAPLAVYSGTWQVSRSGAAKPDVLVNQCAELGKYFACGQTVNGASAGLVVFIAKNGAAEHYVTQTIMPDGRAGGPVNLDIAGDTWTFSSRRDEYGKTTFYRTLNVFSGRNKIHFSSEHSADGKNWTVDSSGDEVRSR